MSTIRVVAALSMLSLLLLTPPAQTPATPTRSADRGWPSPERGESDEPLVSDQAHVQGKYRHLLRVLHLPGDRQSYNEFTDWGLWNGTEWGGYKNLPPGYWVYVYPHWYIWKELSPQK